MGITASSVDIPPFFIIAFKFDLNYMANPVIIIIYTVETKSNMWDSPFKIHQYLYKRFCTRRMYLHECSLCLWIHFQIMLIFFQLLLYDVLVLVDTTLFLTSKAIFFVLERTFENKAFLSLNFCNTTNTSIMEILLFYLWLHFSYFFFLFGIGTVYLNLFLWF